jgi:hypothetical protein
MSVGKSGNPGSCSSALFSLIQSHPASGAMPSEDEAIGGFPSKACEEWTLVNTWRKYGEALGKKWVL